MGHMHSPGLKSTRRLACGSRSRSYLWGGMITELGLCSRIAVLSFRGALLLSCGRHCELAASTGTTRKFEMRSQPCCDGCGRSAWRSTRRRHHSPRLAGTSTSTARIASPRLVRVQRQVRLQCFSAIGLASHRLVTNGAGPAADYALVTSGEVFEPKFIPSSSDPSGGVPAEP
jgi:hypothetical protein